MKPFEETSRLMEKYGISMPGQKLAKNPSEALSFANDIGYPVVMKFYSPKISHKTDVGGVFTNVKRVDVREIFGRLMKIKDCKSVLVQKQVKGIETIVGGIDDPQFGPCISFGTGGIFVEVLKDVNFRVCPITKNDAREMIRGTKIYRILKGYRGKKYDLDRLAETLVKVSKIMCKEKIRELDINPMICSRRGVWAVDVRVA